LCDGPSFVEFLDKLFDIFYAREGGDFESVLMCFFSRLEQPSGVYYISTLTFGV